MITNAKQPHLVNSVDTEAFRVHWHLFCSVLKALQQGQRSLIPAQNLLHGSLRSTILSGALLGHCGAGGEVTAKTRVLKDAMMQSRGVNPQALVLFPNW